MRQSDRFKSYFENYREPTFRELVKGGPIVARMDQDVLDFDGKLVSVKEGDEADIEETAAGEALIVWGSTVLWHGMRNCEKEALRLWKRKPNETPEVVPGQVWFDGTAMLYVSNFDGPHAVIVKTSNGLIFPMSPLTIQAQGELLTPISESAKKATHRCKCEINLLLINGCQCGGV